MTKLNRKTENQYKIMNNWNSQQLSDAKQNKDAVTKLKKYNTAEMELMQTVRDRLKWHLGEELGFDPSTDSDASIELEMRFAKWITTGGGEWLRSLPQIHTIYNQK